MFVNGHNLDDAISTMNEELEKLCLWLRVNKLSLNVKKTHYIVFRTKQKKIRRPLIPMKMGDEIIHEAEQTKFLGVVLDQHLDWHHDITNVKRKVSKGNCIINKVKYVLNKNTLLSMYYAFIYPHFQYCVTIWGNTYETYIESLYKLQIKAI